MILQFSNTFFWIEKQAKLIVHILCKLMRLEMKSENEYKILSGTTIRKM